MNRWSEFHSPGRYTLTVGHLREILDGLSNDAIVARTDHFGDFLPYEARSRPRVVTPTPNLTVVLLEPPAIGEEP